MLAGAVTVRRALIYKLLRRGGRLRRAAALVEPEWCAAPLCAATRQLGRRCGVSRPPVTGRQTRQ